MSPSNVRLLFKYEAGQLYWIFKVSDKIKIGQLAGSFSGKYGIIKYLKKTYQVHRLIFLYHKGYNPKTVDHINLNTKDNRIENLRDASYSENLRNTRKLTKGLSPYKGVTFDKRRNKWISRIKLKNKRLYLGSFDNEIIAAKEYDKNALKYFGKFANINFKEK